MVHEIINTSLVHHILIQHAAVAQLLPVQKCKLGMFNIGNDVINILIVITLAPA